MIDDKKISDANKLTMSAAQYAHAERDDARDMQALSRADIDADADRGLAGSEAMLARLHQVLGELQGASSAGGADSALSSDSAALGQAFARLIDAGVDRPPLPGSGNGATLARWRMLAAVGGTDVSLVKLYEGHTDALAILAELHGDAPPPGTRWAVWAAEPPNARLTAQSDARPTSSYPSYTSISSTSPTHGDAVRLDGIKAWCSGAAHVTHALVTAWLNEQPCLVSVAMDQPGVTVTSDGWQARGMAATGSVDVRFEAAMGTLVGAPGAYLSRPGFWHGGAGIAACWMGATAAIARYTLRRLAAKARPRTTAAPGLAALPASARREQGSPNEVVIDDLSALYAAELDLAMAAATTLLRDIASEIDRVPAADARAVATRARLDIEALAERVLRTAGRALGAAPLCRDAHFAALMTDLPVFLRQSHAERDLAAYGRAVLESAPQQHVGHKATGESRWTL